MNRSVASKVFISVLVISAFATVFAPTALADGRTNSFLPRTVEPWYGLFGASFGCIVNRAGNRTEIRVTSKRAVSKAKRMIANKTKVKGARLHYVRRVDPSQSLKNYLAAWVYAASALAGQYGSETTTAPAKHVSSPVEPTSTRKCRSVIVGVYSYPDHVATAGDIAWAQQIAAQYPKTIVTDIQTLANRPVFTQ